jgi:hypothetical protein
MVNNSQAFGGSLTPAGLPIKIAPVVKKGE